MTDKLILHKIEEKYAVVCNISDRCEEGRGGGGGDGGGGGVRLEGEGALLLGLQRVRNFRTGLSDL